MKVEVIFHDHIASYNKGQIVEIEEGPFLISILLGNKADAINPPDWTLESYTNRLLNPPMEIKEETPKKISTRKTNFPGKTGNHIKMNEE